MNNKGFTLVELLIVIAISVLIIGLAIVGSNSTQSQNILFSSAQKLESNIQLMKTDATSSITQFSGFNYNDTPEIIYGFFILPANSITQFCSNNCNGYVLGILVNDAPHSTPPCSIQYDLNNCNTMFSYVGGIVLNSIYLYYHQFQPGVTMSLCNPASTTTCNNYFPLFQELNGNISLYNTNSPFNTYAGNSSWYLSYENYYIPVNFDTQGNTFSLGKITNG